MGEAGSGRIAPHAGSACDLSIVVPAYNALPYCKALVESIVRQDFGGYAVEVIVVDDGSTDGTGEYFDEAGARYPWFRVLHQPNSGGPAHPRNRGIGESRGTYLFFADADDCFVGNAVRRMLDRAFREGIDVGVVQIDASAWGITYGGLFEKGASGCTVENSPILNTLGPCKLFERRLVVENDLRFPEGVSYEDLPFSLEAYLNARNVAVLADGPYYKYVKREDGESLSQGARGAGPMYRTIAGKVDGIANYLAVCRRYASCEELPVIYVRAFRYAERLFASAQLAADDALYRRFRAELASCYGERVRALLPFSLLCATDAFVYLDKGEFLRYRAERARYRNLAGDAHGFPAYRLVALDGRELLSMRFPAAPGDKLLRPEYKRATLDWARMSGGKVQLAGSAEMLYPSTGAVRDVQVTAKLYGREDEGEFPAKVVASRSVRVYPEVWFSSFKWSCAVPAGAFEQMAGDAARPARIDLFLAAKSADTTVTCRLGAHSREEVIERFAEGSLRLPRFQLGPVVTKYGNISLSAEDA